MALTQIGLLVRNQRHRYFDCTYYTLTSWQQSANSHALQRKNHPYKSSVWRNFSKTVSSCYDTLEVGRNASQSQIKAAYYRLSKRYHPDINKAENASEKFAAIAEAYEILGNKQTRSMYDKGLHRPSREKKGRDAYGNDLYTATRIRRTTGPVRGKTQYYNFDEFYRQHYGETLKQKQEDRQAYEEYMSSVRAHQNAQKTILQNMTFLGVMVGVITIIAKIASRGPK